MDNPKDEKWNYSKCKESPHDCYDGIFHVDPCYSGAPIILSAPYFLDGDPDLLNFFNPQLTPDMGLHGTTLDIEPITAITLNAHKRFQVHINIQYH